MTSLRNPAPAPMTPADRVEKFMDCAGRILGARGAKGLLDQLQRLQGVANVAQLVAQTAPQSGGVTERATT